jgi:CDP-6-deoxy-D-xylo-4-hexulose-3-dehydrase
MDRIFYSASVHDEAEINAVVEVLRSGPQGLWPGKRVTAMERETAKLFGKNRGVMVNSGSSALYLAVELLNLPKGSEVITPAVVFSTDVAPVVRAGLIPVFVDVEPDTYCIDASKIEAAISPKTRAILGVNLAGNLPDWDAIRKIADKHNLKVIEDSCDSLGPTFNGTPTGLRSDLTVTSFANSHVITAGGSGGMLCLNDHDLRDRAVLLRRWGRRSELHYYGSKKKDHNFWEELDGIHYDNQFIFDELAWNFEPSEMGAAFGLEQLKKLPTNWARRQRNFKLYTEFFKQYEYLFVLPRELPGANTVWLGFLLTIRPDAGFQRGHMQEYLDSHEVDTRTIWSGNVVRQPMMKNQMCRVAPDGLAHSDAIMERGVMLPLSHALQDEHVAHVCNQVMAFLKSRGK